MNEIENNYVYEDDEDEISLLDFVSVLIRHRFMIIFGTIAAFVLAVSYLFLFPIVIKSADKHEVTIQYSLQVTSLPYALEQELGFDNQKLILKLSEYNLKKLTLLAEEVNTFKPFGDETKELNAYEYNSFIQNIVSKKIFDVSVSPLGNEIIINFRVPENNIHIANAMISDMTQKTSAAIEDYIFPKINTVEKNLKESLSGVSDTQSSVSVQKMKEIQILIQNFKSSYSGFLNENGNPFILLEPLGRLKKLIVFVFAVFVVLVIIAFIINVVDNIKKDPESNEKIQEAWNSGKINRKK